MSGSKAFLGKFKIAINAIITGLLLSLAVTMIASYIFSSSFAAIIFIVAVIGFIYWMFKADTVKRMWARTFAGLSMSSFALPIAILIFGIKETAKETGAKAVGSAIGTGIATVFAAFLGICIGLFFAIAAYFTYKSIPRPVTIEKKIKEKKIKR